MILKTIVLLFQLSRWGKTPLDEGQVSGNKKLIKLLEEAKSAQILEFPHSQKVTGIAN